jgi:hypothetical protein
MGDSFKERREWFEEYARRFLEDSVVILPKDGARFACPCCGYPTLTSRGQYSICGLCWWEDDGQEDPHADEVWGGPNHEYSLTRARKNFADHLTMYDRGKDTRGGGEDTPKVAAAKRKLIAAYEALRTDSDPARIRPLWTKVHAAEKALRKADRG